MNQIEIKSKIERALPGSSVQVEDLTGTQDHYRVVVVSDQFVGKTMVNQHRLVKAVFENDIQSGSLHALSLKTYTPDEWARAQGVQNG